MSTRTRSIIEYKPLHDITRRPKIDPELSFLSAGREILDTKPTGEFYFAPFVFMMNWDRRPKLPDLEKENRDQTDVLLLLEGGRVQMCLAPELYQKIVDGIHAKAARYEDDPNNVSLRFNLDAFRLFSRTGQEPSFIIGAVEPAPSTIGNEDKPQLELPLGVGNVPVRHFPSTLHPIASWKNFECF